MFVPWHVFFSENSKYTAGWKAAQKRQNGPLALLLCGFLSCTWTWHVMRAEVRYKNKAVYSSQTREWIYGLHSTTLKVNWIKADVRCNNTSLAHFIWFYASVIIMVFVGAAYFRDIVTSEASIQCHRCSEDILGVPCIICIHVCIYRHPYMHP